jgi:uncharacterized membrane protein (DUF373 family)
MVPKKDWIELSAICALFILISVWGVVWDITSGLLWSGIDGIMLLFVRLMMGGIFSLILILELYRAGILPSLRRSKAKVKAEASSVQSLGSPAQTNTQGK